MRKDLQKIQYIIRKAKMLSFIEYFRYIISVLQHRKRNNIIKKKYPTFLFPPQYLAYDAYSAPDWDHYYQSGKQTALDIKEMNEEYNSQSSNIKILEWGCGPARIIRHLPTAFGSSANIYGTDYNQKTIQWNKDNIIDVEFFNNDLKPPLPFEDNTFDFVYAISVFTHLTEESCIEWIGEISRVLKDSGKIFFTTNCDSLCEYFLPQEHKLYTENGFVYRGNIKEGKKMSIAFHSPKYVQNKLLKDFDILQHYVPNHFKYITIQDSWIATKK